MAKDIVSALKGALAELSTADRALVDDSMARIRKDFGSSDAGKIAVLIVAHEFLRDG